MDCFEQTTTIIGLVIQFFVAIGTIGLAAFAYFEINKRKNEYRSQRLHEIIEWAQSAIEWKYSPNEIKSHPENPIHQWLELTLLLKLSGESLTGIARRGYIISKSATIIKNETLNEKVKILNNEIMKTLMKNGSLWNAAKQGLNTLAGHTTEEFVKAHTELQAQLQIQINAAENLIFEIGKLVQN